MSRQEGSSPRQPSSAYGGSAADSDEDMDWEEVVVPNVTHEESALEGTINSGTAQGAIEITIRRGPKEKAKSK